MWFGGLQRPEEIESDFPEVVAADLAKAESVPTLCVNIFPAASFPEGLVAMVAFQHLLT